MSLKEGQKVFCWQKDPVTQEDRLAISTIFRCGNCYTLSTINACWVVDKNQGAQYGKRQADQVLRNFGYFPSLNTTEEGECICEICLERSTNTDTKREDHGVING